MRPRALPRCSPHARYGGLPQQHTYIHTTCVGLPRSRSVIAWRTVLWVVLHVHSRPWVVSGGNIHTYAIAAIHPAVCSAIRTINIVRCRAGAGDGRQWSKAIVVCRVSEIIKISRRLQVYAVYAISSLDTGSPLKAKWTRYGAILSSPDDSWLS